jgi:hypothetical protein
MTRHALVPLFFATTLSCAATQNMAAQDPMKCERDPSCTHHADKAKDCVTQCVDDPACIDRCRQVTGQGEFSR